MAQQKITLTKDELTQYSALIGGGIKLSNAQAALHATKFTSLPPDIHTRIMEAEKLLESINTDIRRAMKPKIRKLYEGL